MFDYRGVLPTGRLLPRNYFVLDAIREGVRYVYIIRSLKVAEDLYVGSTADVAKRLTHHNGGRCPYTAKNKPWVVVYIEPYEDEDLVLKRERQIKRWSRAKKEALINGDTQTLKKLSKRKGK
ncbi:MAG: GIY-YIG nuclease family protein [Deltaproteobacteria bacterium]|nr:GIY-YIG nuclease family protein [Deltaproteobacteria bacterium]